LYFSADPNDVVSYTFLDAKCGSNDELNVYQSLEVQANGVDRSSTFSIESFNFQGEEGGDIFLHCDVSDFNRTLIPNMKHVWK